jgi:glycogen(starch) synthase
MVLSVPRAYRTALWVVPVADLGGVARHVLDVVRAGLPGWRLVVLCPPGPLADEVRRAGGAVLTAPFGPDAGLRASLASLRHTIRKLRPQVVHSHLSYADVVAALATPRGVTLVTTEHGIAADDAVYHSSGSQARMMAGVHAVRLRRFDRVIAVSTATADAMRGKWHVRQHIEVIPNGVDVPVDVPEPRPGLRFLSLARLAPEKRIGDLLDAFAFVAKAEDGATLTIAGVGPLELQLKARADRLGLAAQVRFPGFLEADTALATADVVAQLSVWENCSYTLLDAIARGLGVVASPVGGNPELLPRACLVDPTDHEGVASRMLSQARDLTARPKPAHRWPSTADVARDIAAVYQDATP